MYSVDSLCHNIGSHRISIALILGLLYQCWYLRLHYAEITNTTLGTGVDCSCHNIGSKNLILNSVPELAFESTIWGDYKHDIVYGAGSSCHNIGSKI